MKDTPSLSDTQRQEIAATLFKGDKIAAIKLYRAAVGGDLAGAKAFVERLEGELREATPESFANPAGGKSGCFGLLIAGGMFGAAWLLVA